MKDIIKIFKDLSYSGVLLIHLGNRRIRIINSSNIISSLQRVLPELEGSEKIEVLNRGMSDRKLRSVSCYIHKKRLEGLGYNIIESSIRKWEIHSKAEDVGGVYKWVVRLKNRYSSIVIGVFELSEMEEFLEKYYPQNCISAVVISSNEATRKYYEVYKER